MNTRIAVLRHRRALLVARAAMQRTQVEQALRPWFKPLMVVDTLIEVARVLRRHPALAVAGASLFASGTRHRWLMWVGRLATFWDIALALRALWRKRTAG